MEVNHASQLGTVVFGPPQPVEIAHSGDPQRTITVLCAQGEWRPAPRVARFLPDDFHVRLECYTGPDGLRRIIPQCNFEELIDLGGVGGLAVLQDRCNLDPKQANQYRGMRVIHQHVRGRQYLGTRGMAEHLTRRFQYSCDLHVRRTGRQVSGERDVLPEDFGLTDSGEGQRLSVAQLTRLGRTAAIEAGCCNPTGRPAIQFGLYETARCSPLEVEPDRVSSFVQMALFDTDSIERVSPELVDTVWGRLTEALENHAGDSSDAFYRWFLGPNNTLVKQLAQPKGKQGGKLKREDVRSALLQIGRQAYEHLGQCVHALMRTIKNAIVPVLNDAEKRLFEQMHESQPYYGDLPVALLAERSEDIELAIQVIWNEPQAPEHIGVLHRLLYWYGEMARKRRRADSQFKQRRPPAIIPATPNPGVVGPATDDEVLCGTSIIEGPDNSGFPFVSRKFIDGLHAAPASARSQFDVAEHIRQLNQLECPRGCSLWKYRLYQSTDDRVDIRVRCDCGKIVQTISMTRAELAACARMSLARRRPEKDDPAGDGPAPIGKS